MNPVLIVQTVAVLLATFTAIMAGLRARDKAVEFRTNMESRLNAVKGAVEQLSKEIHENGFVRVRDLERELAVAEDTHRGFQKDVDRIDEELRDIRRRRR